MSTWRLEDAEAHLLSLELFGMRFGLERMRRLLTVLGSPQERLRAIHVVGTNGKSSTARMIAASVTSSGGRASQYPPSAPRWLRTIPACLRSPRMFSRNLSGMPCACAIRSPFTGPSASAASAAQARMA